MGFFKRIRKQVSRSFRKVEKQFGRDLGRVTTLARRSVKKVKKDPLGVLGISGGFGLLEKGQEALEKTAFGPAIQTLKTGQRVFSQFALPALAGAQSMGFFSDLFRTATAGIKLPGAQPTGFVGPPTPLGSVLGTTLRNVGGEFLQGAARQGISQLLEKNKKTARLIGLGGGLPQIAPSPPIIQQRAPVVQSGLGGFIGGNILTDLALGAGVKNAQIMRQGVQRLNQQTAGRRRPVANGFRLPPITTQTQIAKRRNVILDRPGGTRGVSTIGKVMMTADGQTFLVPFKKRRRMNPLNPRALTRALRRVEGFQRAVRRTRKVTRKIKL